MYGFKSSLVSFYTFSRLAIFGRNFFFYFLLNTFEFLMLYIFLAINHEMAVIPVLFVSAYKTRDTTVERRERERERWRHRNHREVTCTDNNLALSRVSEFIELIWLDLPSYRISFLPSVPIMSTKTYFHFGKMKFLPFAVVHVVARSRTS